MNKIIFTLILGLTLSLAGLARSSNLTFYFTNPSFGGNPMYGDFLLREAEMQNSFKEKSGGDFGGYEPESPLTEFQDSLSREVLYRLSQKVVDEAFGEDGVQEGHYQIGSYVIDVTPGSSGITINIKDISSGGSTTVQVPYY
ncbi:curli production assembly/transport component CsgF [Thermosulfidibacter takaii]|nr:curli production assembly/transport component CsgF [Thermosulfidibacter takaii]